jgi:coenzyme F420-0:L-glutamate ligase/coenzyme F420-1:gamma-L-glutamate ligase
VNGAERDLTVLAVSGMPEVREGDRLGELIAARARFEDGDVVVVSQKAVSKAEGRVVRLTDVTPSARARRLAAEHDKDPALVELVLAESREILRAEHGVLICETYHGLVCANAGVDTSNVAEGRAALLPRDPDASARRVRAEIRGASGMSPAVVVSDSFGRAWRQGQVEVAIGCAGLRPLDDWRDRTDAAGHLLTATVIAIADEAAAAAGLVRGVGSLVSDEDGPGARALLRPREQDLFR